MKLLLVMTLAALGLTAACTTTPTSAPVAATETDPFLNEVDESNDEFEDDDGPRSNQDGDEAEV